MVKDSTKRIAGIILLAVGLVFIPILFISIMMLTLLPIPIISLFLGFFFLYRGLSIQKRGIMLLTTGGIFIFFTMFIFTYALPHVNTLIALSIVNVVFWVLCFIVPGIIKIIKKIEFKERATYLYALAPITVFWLYIYTIIIAGITASTPATFISLYYQYFFIALGCGFLLSLIIIGLAYFEIYL